MPNPTVKAGDREFTIAEFSSYKFLEATELIGNMLDVLPDLDETVESFVKSYAERTRDRQAMNRATAVMRYGDLAQRITEEDWAKSGDQLVIESSDEPSQWQILLRIVPKLQKHARSDLMWLLALIVTPNSALEAADENGTDLYGDQSPLQEYRKHLMHRTKVSELVVLIAAAFDVLGSEISDGDVMAALGNLQSRLPALQGKAAKDTEEKAPNRKARRAKGSGRGAPRTSTSSRARTKAGAAATSSTESPTGS